MDLPKQQRRKKVKVVEQNQTEDRKCRTHKKKKRRKEEKKIRRKEEKYKIKNKTKKDVYLQYPGFAYGQPLYY